jgi:hypothetical protein
MSALLLALLVAAPTAPSSLERAADQLCLAVVRGGFEPPVALAVEGAPRALSRALASLLASRLALAHLAPVVLEGVAVAEAERQARERGLPSLVRLGVTREGSRLVVRGDALGTHVNFWSGSVPTRSGPAVALAVSVALDAQASLLLGPEPGTPAGLELAVSTLLRLPAVPAALAVADLDGDHRAEVLALVQDRLWVLGPGGAVARADLVGPLAARPSREPFGLLVVSPGRVLVASARRERPEAFAWPGLRPLGPVDGLTVEGVGVSQEPGLNRFLAEVSWHGKALTLPARPQALASSGGLVAVAFADGTAAMTRAGLPSSRAQGVGTGLALADLDGDGEPEVVLTTARTSGDADEVRVLSQAAMEALQARGGSLADPGPVLWQQAMPGRVVVAAAGDLDGDGQDEVVLGRWWADGTGELLVLSRSVP